MLSMRALLKIVAVSSCLALAAACSHDLDAVKSERNLLRDAGPRGGSGDTGKPAGSGGKGGSSSGSGGGEVDAGPTCGPCPELGPMAATLGLRDCCRGTVGDECGITIGDGTLCLPRMVPGQTNASCDELRIGGMRLPGCCRPDGRCGVVADGLGLGCVARDEIVPALGGTAPEPLPCEYTCATDDDCSAVLEDLVCAESRDRSKRTCARVCKRNQECPRLQICGLSNDVEMDRVLAICQPPIGEGDPGDFCSSADDCVHGVCTVLRVGGDPFCTQLCRNAAECGTEFKSCKQSGVPTPSGNSRENFDICLP